MKKICWNYKTPGIPDELFVRGNVPMTKEEVRAITLSKLRPREDSIVVDVGAGTGSIAIEAAHLCPKGKVIAIERKEEGVALIRENCARFQVEVEILHGNAADKLKTMKAFDRVIIGGSGGELEEIIQLCHDKLTKDGRIVVNSITLETLYASIQCLEKIGFSHVEAVSVNVARGRKVGRYTLMEALNPIYVISGVKK